MTDQEKIDWAKATHHFAIDDPGYLRYYNCWHCKECGEEIVDRMCDCGKLWDQHELEEYTVCCQRDSELTQICRNKCENIGGLKEFNRS